MRNSEGGSDQHGRRTLHQINGKHVAATAVGLMWAFLSTQAPGPLMQEFMPLSIPAVAFVSAVLAYIFLDFMLPNYGKQPDETTGGEADEQ